jgi:hypothetical protein
MNKTTEEKYAEMTQVTKLLQGYLEQVQKKSNNHISAPIFFLLLLVLISFSFASTTDQEFQPYLEKINQIDQNVTELEHSVAMLDDYTKRLGEKKANQCTS